MSRGRRRSAPAPGVGLVNLGCPKNLVDAETIAGGILRRGLRIVGDLDEADVILINTCAFVEEASQESIDVILDVIRSREQDGRPAQKIVVGGCLPQRWGGELARLLPEVDAFIGPPQAARAGEIIEEVLGFERPRRSCDSAVCHLTASPRRAAADLDAPRLRLTPAHWAYVRIAEGCAHRCAFCVIPRIRGPQRSRAPASIEREMRELADQGVREFNLIAQDTTAYGADLGPHAPRLDALLERLGSIPGDFWVRLLYTHPAGWDTRLMKTVAAIPRIVPYVDVPLQHVHPDILRAMGRRRMPQGGPEELVDQLRGMIPGVCLRTTFIAGFPGETERHFEALLEFIARARFPRLGLFAYSPEEGTRAASFPGQVPLRTRRERVRRAMTLQQGISREIGRERVGSTLRILVDARREGRTEWDAPEIDGRVALDADCVPGRFVQVRVTAAADYDLHASLCTHDAASGAAPSSAGGPAEAPLTQSIPR